MTTRESLKVNLISLAILSIFILCFMAGRLTVSVPAVPVIVSNLEARGDRLTVPEEQQAVVNGQKEWRFTVSGTTFRVEDRAEVTPDPNTHIMTSSD